MFIKFDLVYRSSVRSSLFHSCRLQQTKKFVPFSTDLSRQNLFGTANRRNFSIQQSDIQEKRVYFWRVKRVKRKQIKMYRSSMSRFGGPQRPQIRKGTRFGRRRPSFGVNRRAPRGMRNRRAFVPSRKPSMGYGRRALSVPRRRAPVRIGASVPRRRRSWWENSMQIS